MSRFVAVFRIVPDFPQNVVDVKNRLLVLDPNMLVEEPLGLGMSAFQFTKILHSPEHAENVGKRIRGLKNIMKVEQLSLSPLDG